MLCLRTITLLPRDACEKLRMHMMHRRKLAPCSYVCNATPLRYVYDMLRLASRAHTQNRANLHDALH